MESNKGHQTLQCFPDRRLCVQVIEEIEEMMQDSPDPEDDESPSQSDLSMLSQDLGALRRSGSNTSYEDRECSASQRCLQAGIKIHKALTVLFVVRSSAFFFSHSAVVFPVARMVNEV